MHGSLEFPKCEKIWSAGVKVVTLYTCPAYWLFSKKERENFANMDACLLQKVARQELPNIVFRSLFYSKIQKLFQELVARCL